MQTKNDIFVFGSNLSGYHGAGAAHIAHTLYGAKWGRGVGLYGRSYALPTKDKRILTLPLTEVDKYVEEFIGVAIRNPQLTFWVTKVGCGLAGFTDNLIAPLFHRSFIQNEEGVELIKNIKLPKDFLDILRPKGYSSEWISFTF
jgi:hypothetical protein